MASRAAQAIIRSRARQCQRCQELEDDVAGVDLAVDDVQTLDERADAGTGGPERKQNGDDEGDAKPLLRHVEQRLELALDEAVGVGRQQRPDLVEVCHDVGGIGDQPIEPDKRRERRKDRQDAEEGDTRRHDRQVVTADVGIDPPKHFAPGGPAEAGGTGSVAAGGIRSRMRLRRGRIFNVTRFAQCRGPST